MILQRVVALLGALAFGTMMIISLLSTPGDPFPTWYNWVGLVFALIWLALCFSKNFQVVRLSNVAYGAAIIGFSTATFFASSFLSLDAGGGLVLNASWHPFVSGGLGLLILIIGLVGRSSPAPVTPAQY
jgi:hypothetical protein